jgi:hypothetical protein
MFCEAGVSTIRSVPWGRPGRVRSSAEREARPTLRQRWAPSPLPASRYSARVTFANAGPAERSLLNGTAQPPPHRTPSPTAPPSASASPGPGGVAPSHRRKRNDPASQEIPPRRFQVRRSSRFWNAAPSGRTGTSRERRSSSNTATSRWAATAFTAGGTAASKTPASCRKGRSAASGCTRPDTPRASVFLITRAGTLKAVQKLLGHSSISTTGDIYTDWDIDQLAETLRDMLEQGES